jgi:hypothetical protein
VLLASFFSVFPLVYFMGGFIPPKLSLLRLVIHTEMCLKLRNLYNCWQHMHVMEGQVHSCLHILVAFLINWSLMGHLVKMVVFICWHFVNLCLILNFMFRYSYVISRSYACLYTYIVHTFENAGEPEKSVRSWGAKWMGFYFQRVASRSFCLKEIEHDHGDMSAFLLDGPCAC